MEVHTASNNTMKVKETGKILSLFNRDPPLFTTGKWLMPKLKKMDLTDLFIGLKRNQGKRMDLSREKCGRRHPGILEIGETTARKDLEYSSIQMETNMKACGPWTENTDRAHTGGMNAEN